MLEGKPLPKRKRTANAGNGLTGEEARTAVKEILTQRGSMTLEDLRKAVAERARAQGKSAAGLHLKLTERALTKVGCREKDGAWTLASVSLPVDQAIAFRGLGEMRADRHLFAPHDAVSTAVRPDRLPDCESFHNRCRLRNWLGVDPQKSLKATLKRLSELNPESRAIVRIFSSEVTSIRWAC